MKINVQTCGGPRPALTSMTCLLQSSYSFCLSWKLHCLHICWEWTQSALHAHDLQQHNHSLSISSNLMLTAGIVASFHHRWTVFVDRLKVGWGRSLPPLSFHTDHSSSSKIQPCSFTQRVQSFKKLSGFIVFLLKWTPFFLELCWCHQVNPWLIVFPFVCLFICFFFLCPVQVCVTALPTCLGSLSCWSLPN